MTVGENVDQINIVCDKWVEVVEDLVLFGLQGEPIPLRMRLLEQAKTEIRKAQRTCVAKAVSI